ncbi:hypothetical protein [Streptomyces liangshanensis]|uniref:Uncharacterized protein n=1 Tax=Streptomyces liangshanensis TaxID=2717324 RepID=A0A6G9H7H8_9ACTN|nr:hypothetical protein [Streptomyces liangshanensis]QIQ06171.1 hypothetical protein HA039_31105 [Streptomyces liangshanensis]
MPLLLLFLLADAAWATRSQAAGREPTARGGATSPAVHDAPSPPDSLVIRDPGLGPSQRLVSEGRWSGETETKWLMDVCEGRQRTWRTDGGDEAQAVVWSCPSGRDAATLVWFAAFDPDFFTRATNLRALPGVWLAPQVRYVSGARSQKALFAQGSRAVQVSVRTPAEGRLDALTGRVTEMAVRQTALVPGERATLTQPEYSQGMVALLIMPAVGYALYILPWRLIRTWPVWRPYRVRRRDPAWRDVSRTALKLAALVRVRAAFRVFGFLVLFLLVTTRNLTVEPVVMLAVAFAGGWLLPGRSHLLKLAWQPRPVRGRWDVRGTHAWVVRGCGLASLLLYAAGVGVFFLFYIAQLSGLGSSPLIDGGLPTERYLQVQSFSHLVVFLMLAVVGLGASSSVIVLSALLMVGGVLIRRLGRSYALTNAEAAQRDSPEPPVLYLRSFTDDSATMPSSAIARTSVLERASFAWRQPFEEITVRHVWALGPVIAASHPADTRSRSDIGAARMRLGPDWQTEIEAKALGSRLVVVGATPEAINEGLRQELEILAMHPSVPVALVLAPMAGRELTRRWHGFIDAALTVRGPRGRRDSRFAGLRAHRNDTTGALVLLNTGGTEWQVWGARRRTEFTFATAWGEARDALTGTERRRTVGGPRDRGQTAGPNIATRRGR